MLEAMIELTIVAAAAFLAATILPVASEALVVNAIVDASAVYIAAVVAVAAIANTLGSALNYWLGAYLARFQGRRWFYFSGTQVSKGKLYFERFGLWSLLFAWLPVVGDLLTLAAGILRGKFWFFASLVLVGKAARYIAVAYIALKAFD